MAGKITGLGMLFYVDGIALHGDTNSFDRIGGGPGERIMTGVDKSGVERRGGQLTGGIKWKSYFNPDSGRAHPKLSALPTGQVIASVLFGQTIGHAGAAVVARQLDYSGSRPKDGMFLFDVPSESDGYGLEMGTTLTAGDRTDTAATAAAAVTAHDGLASSAFGLQMYVQLSAFIGTSVTIKLQESSDDSGDTYADVTGATTGALSAVGAARVATAGDLAVERYLKVVTTGTFSEATFNVLVMRNATATTF